MWTRTNYVSWEDIVFKSWVCYSQYYNKNMSCACLCFVVLKLDMDGHWGDLRTSHFSSRCCHCFFLSLSGTLPANLCYTVAHFCTIDMFEDMTFLGYMENYIARSSLITHNLPYSGIYAVLSTILQQQCYHENPVIV